MNWKTRIFAILCMLMSGALHAQDSLNLSQLISKALEQNFDIAIAKNESSIAKNNATKGQAGYLPTVNLNGNANYSNNNTKLTFAGGLPDVEVDGAQNTSLGGNVGFNYVIFNGFGRVHTYQNLMNNQQLSQMQAQVVAENLVMDIVTRYLDIQQNELNLDAAKQNLAISADRLKRASLASKLGAKSKLDVMSAQVDYNNDSLNILNIATAINKQKAALNILMGESPSTPLLLSNQIEVPTPLEIEKTKELALQNNTSLLLAQVAQSIAANQAEIADGRKLPTLVANGAYGYTTAQNGAGIVLSQSNLGFSGGLTLSMPLYNGNQLSNALKNANLAAQNSDLQLEKAKLSILNQLEAAQLDYALLVQTLQTQEENVALAERTLSRAQASYANGQISFNDLRMAQLNLLVAKNAINQAKMNLVRIQYTTAKLSGGLLQ